MFPFTWDRRKILKSNHFKFLLDYLQEFWKLKHTSTLYIVTYKSKKAVLVTSQTWNMLMSSETKIRTSSNGREAHCFLSLRESTTWLCSFRQAQRISENLFVALCDTKNAQRRSYSWPKHTALTQAHTSLNCGKQNHVRGHKHGCSLNAESKNLRPTRREVSVSQHLQTSSEDIWLSELKTITIQCKAELSWWGKQKMGSSTVLQVGHSWEEEAGVAGQHWGSGGAGKQWAGRVHNVLSSTVLRPERPNDVSLQHTLLSLKTRTGLPAPEAYPGLQPRIRAECWKWRPLVLFLEDHFLGPHYFLGLQKGLCCQTPKAFSSPWHFR